MTFDRESASTDALLTDLYLDALLAGVVLEAAGTNRAPDAAARIDPAARRAADRLRRDLVRVHPSFRFEERLATRLAEAAVALRVPVAVGDGGRVVAFRSEPAVADDADLLPLDDGDRAGESAPGSAHLTSPSDPTHRYPARPLLIGGALTSAALSIAGAAFVAWRFGRPGRASTPMARAARAVREARLTGIAGDAMTTLVRTGSRRLD
ncbi:MAG: hypothetical protein H0V73_04750 [Chloroflexi bacterium]|nr:hypothetical protein [Chloroflexota bacterium]